MEVSRIYIYICEVTHEMSSKLQKVLVIWSQKYFVNSVLIFSCYRTSAKNGRTIKIRAH
jgi:hypothetical protein